MFITSFSTLLSPNSVFGPITTPALPSDHVRRIEPRRQLCPILLIRLTKFLISTFRLSMREGRLLSHPNLHQLSLQLPSMALCSHLPPMRRHTLEPIHLFLPNATRRPTRPSVNGTKPNEEPFADFTAAEYQPYGFVTVFGGVSCG
jgi:hypothetical protein